MSPRTERVVGDLEALCAQPLESLKEMFWTLARRVVEPLAEYAATRTTPSIERSVLMRMGFDSVRASAFVDQVARQGRLGDGAARVLIDHAEEHRCSVRASLARLLGEDAGDPLEPTRPELARLPPLRVARDEPLPIGAILDGLRHYRPRRRGWTWRRPVRVSEPFNYRELSQPLGFSGGLQAAAYFGGADPQPDCTVTAEIASGRFEDDLRRMRMAAWHGADHIMVIRTLGQSHYDGLIEGTPEGVGGVPITRKQLRATRRALDLIEDEVGRPINLHSYVSGLAGSEMAVLFAEEGVNGAHQDFQYNILYRGVNPARSVVDAFEAKSILAGAGILQVDGAHNANSTALRAWNVRPELLVQHALNCVASELAGMRREYIALSTVPPTAPPAPKLALDLPYALALRHLFDGFAMRAQQNTRYSTTDQYEATVLHALDTLVSRLCGVDIQSTIAPDEARCIPWHAASVRAVSATKQMLVGLDGLREMTQPDLDVLRPEITEIVARAVLMLRDIEAAGGYFPALADGFFVDSGAYPDREHDGIRRPWDRGVGADTVVSRSERYVVPVCSHYGHAIRPSGGCTGCTLCDDRLVPYLDEPDAEDNVHRRLAAARARDDVITPEAERCGDGQVTLSMFLPLPVELGDVAVLQIARMMSLREPRIVDRVVLHPAEGVQYEISGQTTVRLRRADLPPPRRRAGPDLAPEDVRVKLAQRGVRVVGGTIGDDEHSVGLQEITNIKHQGLEWFGVTCVTIGSSVLVDRLLDEAVEHGACAVLASTIVSHRGVHEVMLRRLAEVAVERGVRDRILLIGGGPQVTNELAVSCGLDAGFGPGTRGLDVARFLVTALARGDAPAGEPHG